MSKPLTWNQIHRGKGIKNNGAWNVGRDRMTTPADHAKTALRFKERRRRDVREFAALGVIDPDSETARKYVDG